MVRRNRLDSELVRRGLVPTRERAAELITSGQVTVAGVPAGNPNTRVALSAPIVVVEDTEPRYASRGGHKLAGALVAFAEAGGGEGGLSVEGKRCLDAGASAGGFTDVLLRAGASHVTAVDVSYGQLAWSLRSDPRVTVLERTNVRELGAEQVGEPAEVVVADLSFISVAAVLSALRRRALENADFVLLVKPQFEADRKHVERGGVVRDPKVRAEAVRRVVDRGHELGLGVMGVVRSPLPGPAGNVEYFLWLRAGASGLDHRDIDHIVAES